MWDLLQSNKG